MGMTSRLSSVRFKLLRTLGGFLLITIFAVVPVDALAQKVVKISAGAAHVLQLREDGTVWAWGNNEYGQLGNGTRISRSSPVQVIGLNRVLSVVAGARHSVALTTDGAVWAWGGNVAGQLGDGTDVDRVVPVRLTSLGNVVEIRAGWWHTLARTADAQVWSWGQNGIGQLGDSPSLRRLSPNLVPGLSDVVNVAAGGDFSVALRADGTVWAWGANSAGQLGDGTRASHYQPAPVLSLTGVVEISAGGFHCLARDRTGTLFAWGHNDWGQLGDGTNVGRLTPTLVTTISDATELVASYDHSLVRTQRGAVFAWGANYSGQLGDSGFSNRSRPVEVVGLTQIRAIAAGTWFSLVLNADGDVRSWGHNADGQLGSAALAHRRLPARVVGVADVVQVAAGSGHSLVRRKDGSVFGWGWNGWGQLGRPNIADRSSNPIEVSSIRGASDIAAGDGYSLAATLNGDVLSWGFNGSGQLGDGTNTSRWLPTAIPGLVRISSVTTGIGASYAVRTDGSAFSWGGNYFGQLGDGSTTDRWTPVLVLGSASNTLGVASSSHGLARQANGTVAAWGNNWSGQIGDGTTTNQLASIQVPNLDGIAEVAAGDSHSLARRANGEVMAWGSNYSGQLGDGTRLARLLPIRLERVPPAVQVTAGGHRSFLRLANGTIWAWGQGMGGGGEDAVTPQRDPWVEGANAIHTSRSHALVALSSGNVAAFGDNAYGQLGIPGPQNSSVPKPVADVMQPAVTFGAYPVVEYENKGIEGGRYFITAQTEETQALDSLSAVQGSGGGFTRSGRAWRGWRTQAEASAGASGASFAGNIKPVYRFYAPGPNSHFYTVSESERDLLINYNANLTPKVHQYEGAKFYAVQPNGSGATASCPSGTYPVYRAFNNKTSSNQGNHRISSNWIDILRGVRFFGWTNEGIVFCSPSASIPGGDLHAYHTYPGDSIVAGSKMTAECVYNNAGPGAANAASLYCALPHQVNWTLKCVASQGAVCPAIGDNAVNADGTLTPDNLRLGVEVANFPAGGIIHLTATATAPDQSVELSFASAIQEPGGAPDPNPNNNINGLISKTVVKKATDCIVSLSSSNLALLHNDSSTRQISLKAPTGCAWTLSLDSNASSMVSVNPTAGSGDATLSLTGRANGSGQFKSGNLTVTATTAASSSANKTAALNITQEAAPVTDTGCSNLYLTRENERQGPNTINASLGVRASTTSCTWTVQSDQSWVVIQQGANGKGSGSVLYQVEANAGTSERKATLTIRGAQGAQAQTLTIYQSSNATNVALTGGNEGGGAGDGGGDGGGGGGSGGEGGAGG